MSDVLEIKSLIEEQGKSWSEFKIANDARLEAIESKGYAPKETVEKVEKINSDLNKISKDLDELAKKANRPSAPDARDGMTDIQLEHKEALTKYFRTGNDLGLHELEAKALISNSDPDGGYLVDVEMDNQIDRIASTISAMRSVANIRSIGNAAYSKLVKTRGISGGWLEENATSSESTEQQFSKIEIKAEKVYAEPWITNEMLEDSFYDLESDIMMEAGLTFAETEGAAYVTGNGVGRPRGIAAYTTVANASYAWGSVGYIASGKSGAFTSVAPSDALIDLQHGLKQQYRPGAVFMMNDATLAEVRQMKDASLGFYLWQPDTTAGFGGQLLGSRVVVDDNLADVASNSLSIAYGNMQRAYTIVDRRGIAVIRDNITKKGVTKFHVSKRVGGGITNFEAIKLMKMAAS